MQFIYFYLISYSLIGYGIIVSSFLNIKKNHFGYLGLLGLTFFLIISFISSLFINHDYYSNILFLSIGLILFVILRNRINELKKNFFYHLLIFLLLFIFISVSKNHDDFPYYHLTYALNLSENSFMIGTGNFGHGFRTFSSLFFFHSILYMPFVDFYLFHSGPFFIMIFF